MYSFHKKDCLQRAKELIDKADEASLRYACLELRQCIESIAYDKLKMYKEFVPEDEFSRWQPKQVFELLEQLDPQSTKDFTLQIIKENQDNSFGKTVFAGDHRTLTSQHTKKTYNKLGNYLHTPTLLQQKEYPKRIANLATELSKIVENLTHIVESNFDTNIGSIYKFECKSCREIIYHRSSSLEIGKQVKCLKSECGMLYIIDDIQYNQIRYKPIQHEIPCDCGHTSFINYFKLKNPSHIPCQCGKVYDIKQQWVFEERT